MQSDPVSGDMVMSTAYHFDLKNGQRLRFATQDSLTRFRRDPVRRPHIIIIICHCVTPSATIR